ncbi:MAG: hypothetical protein OEY56_13490, partial [Cyclobacteriaceae bacterium]|nr:hypothetical protein [Cyclobacteriaceae bacterium]
MRIASCHMPEKSQFKPQKDSRKLIFFLPGIFVLSGMLADGRKVAGEKNQNPVRHLVAAMTFRVKTGGGHALPLFYEKIMGIGNPLASSDTDQINNQKRWFDKSTRRGAF